MFNAVTFQTIPQLIDLSGPVGSKSSHNTRALRTETNMSIASNTSDDNGIPYTTK